MSAPNDFEGHLLSLRDMCLQLAMRIELALGGVPEGAHPFAEEPIPLPDEPVALATETPNATIIDNDGELVLIKREAPTS